VDVGTDADGRPITYDESTARFSVGGIVTTIERLSAYDRGGQVNWVSNEVRDWARQFNDSRQEFASQQQAAQAETAAQYAAQQRAAAQRARRIASGYNPDSIVRYAGSIKGLATVILILLTLGGVSVGATIASVLHELAPAPAFLVFVTFGLGGFVVGYLASVFLKVGADMMLAVVQTEMNTRDSSFDLGVA